jgi:hypothetical protein
MDAILREASVNFEAFKQKHLFGAPGTSPLNLYHDRTLWDWSQLWNPREFEWKAGITPLADLAVIDVDIDNSVCLDWLLCHHHDSQSIHVQSRSLQDDICDGHS